MDFKLAQTKKTTNRLFIANLSERYVKHFFERFQNTLM